MARDGSILQLEAFVDEAKLQAFDEALVEVPMGLEKATSRAVNKVAVHAKTEILRLITSRMNITQRDLTRPHGRSRVRNVRLRKASYGRLTAEVIIKSRRLRLMYFKARKSGRGVSYAIRPGERKKVEGMFIQTMKTGHRGVFVRSSPPRLSRASKRGGLHKGKLLLRQGLAERTDRRRGRVRGMGFMVSPRLHITEQYGPSVPDVVENIGVIASGAYERGLRDRLTGELETQVGLVLERHRKEVGVAPF